MSEGRGGTVFLGMICLFLTAFGFAFMGPKRPTNQQTEHFLGRTMKIGEVIEVKIALGSYFRYAKTIGYDVTYRGMNNDNTFVVNGNYVKIGMKWVSPWSDPPAYEFELVSGNQEYIIVKISHPRSQMEYLRGG